MKSMNPMFPDGDDTNLDVSANLSGLVVGSSQGAIAHFGGVRREVASKRCERILSAAVRTDEVSHRHSSAPVL
jgi:hypothetical protein